ncbi:hypothetical protein EB796_017444 [Bugula neritina]|uniref:Phosphotransferase n=1 Tax=Bugula neritina TaxID=10212 RepID=A0A7J7JE03_BUGNE|nr:hypothetical protein EB796_017444 [Bugula neritina]
MEGSVIEKVRLNLNLPNNSEKQEKVRDVLGQFFLTQTTMEQIMLVMETEMRLGLSRNPEDRKKSSLQMENTFVHETINGTENGDFLALDLGGTNYRVIYMEMREGKKTKEIMQHYVIPDPILTGTGVSLFDYLADSIAKLLHTENIKSATPIPLGFTFSFPMIQSSLRNALLLTWTKKFKCTDTVMQDVVKMLEAAIERRKDINIEVVAILNDAVGTLMTGAYEDRACGIGLILGTGCNASYMEHLERVEKWEGNTKEEKEEIIDIEWGAFGDNGVLDFFKTQYDFEVDRLSNHKGSFTFEKLFAGLYLGEIVRLVLSDLVSKDLLFADLDESKVEWVHWKGSFTTGHVSKVESDFTDTKAIEVLEELGTSPASAEDVSVLRYACAIVSNRAAKIIVSALTVLLRHIQKDEVTIAVDGSLFSYHPTLRGQMEELIAYTAPETKTKFIEVKDGSGMGAAYVAAVAHRIEQKKNMNGHSL